MVEIESAEKVDPRKTAQFASGNFNASAFEVFQGPIIDMDFPRSVANALRREGQRLAAPQAAIMSLERLRELKKLDFADPHVLFYRLAQGAQVRNPHEDVIKEAGYRNTSGSAVRAYAKYEQVDMRVRSMEHILRSVVEDHRPTLMTASLFPTIDSELGRLDMQAVLAAGQGLPKSYATEGRLLRQIARRLDGVLYYVSSASGFEEGKIINPKKEVRAYNQVLQQERFIDPNLYKQRMSFGSRDISSVVEFLVRRAESSGTGEAVLENDEAVRNYAYLLGVMHLPEWVGKVRNFGAKILHREKPGRWMAIPFLPIHRLLQLGEQVQKAEKYLGDYLAENDSYGAYHAIFVRQKALREQSRLLQRIDTDETYQPQQRHIFRAYAARISQPLAPLAKKAGGALVTLVALLH